MERIYNLKFPKQSVQKGLVEIVNTWGQRFYSLFIDGEYITYTHEKSFETEVLKRSFIKEVTKKSGIDEEDLVFVLVDAHNFMGEDAQYEANFYMDKDGYENLLEIMKKGGIENMKEGHCYFLAKGVSELEQNI